MQLAASSGRPRGRGFTLVELLISMIVCSLVAAGVATMMVTVSYGTSTSRDLRGLVVKSQVVDARLAAAIRGSRSVLAVGADYLLIAASEWRSEHLIPLPGQGPIVTTRDLATPGPTSVDAFDFSLGDLELF